MQPTGTVLYVTRFYPRMLLLAVVALFAVGCSHNNPDRSEGDAVPNTSSDTIEVEFDSLDPSRGRPVDPAGPRADASEVPVEKVQPIGDNNTLVTVFVAPCATVTEVSVSPSGEATVWVVDADCSQERQLVSLTVETP